MECIWASIFDTFQCILGGKLGSKMEPKVIQKGIEKMIQVAGGFESILVRFQELQECPGRGGGPSRAQKFRPSYFHIVILSY